MKYNMKICFPAYKISYSIIFLLILSAIRGIFAVEEIGAAIVAYVALLAAVFCSDTYVMERSEKRWELFALYSRKRKSRTILQRLVLQIIYLTVISAIGYFFFYWQKPVLLGTDSAAFLYGSYLLAVTGTIWFWSTLSMTVSNLFRSQWAGIAVCLVLWLVTNSTFGEAVFGNFNIFSYAFRDLNSGAGNFSWLPGTILSMVLALIMMGWLPCYFKKRG